MSLNSKKLPAVKRNCKATAEKTVIRDRLFNEIILDSERIVKQGTEVL